MQTLAACMAVLCLMLCARTASAITNYQANQSVDVSSAWNGTYLVDVRSGTYDIWNTQTVTSIVFESYLNAAAGILCKQGNQYPTFPQPGLCTEPNSIGLFDGRVKYDVVNNRWIVTVGIIGLPAPYNNSFALAVSTTSDPTGSWYVYEVPDCGWDQPQLGLSPNYVSVTGDFCTPPS